MSNRTAVDAAVETAYGYIGTPYVFGGGDLDGPTQGGFDRAGFSRRVVYVACGKDIGRVFTTQLRQCRIREAGETAEAGDLLFWIHPDNPIQAIRHQVLYTGLMTVIGTVPSGLAVPGVAFKSAFSMVSGSVFGDQTIAEDLLTVTAGRDNPVIAQPPYGNPHWYDHGGQGD